MAFNTKLFDGIVIFNEVVSHGSFTKASEATGHSTSYISKEINKLESRLGVRLLNRTTRSLSLTQEGTLYLRHCQQLIQDAEDAEDALGGQQAEPAGVLKVGCPLSFGLSRIRPLLPEFLSRYPKIMLDLDLNDRKLDIISEGFDVMIRASQQLEDSSLVARRIMQSEGLTLASPEYLSQNGIPATPQHLSEHRTIGYSYLKQSQMWSYTDPDGRQFQPVLQNHILTNSPETNLSLCIAGMGISRMPRFNLSDEIERGKLIELFPEYPRQNIDVFIVYPSRKYMSSKVKCFVDFVLENLSE